MRMSHLSARTGQQPVEAMISPMFYPIEVQNIGYQGRITNDRTCQIRYNSYRIGCKAMNICPVHKVDGQTTISRQQKLA